MSTVPNRRIAECLAATADTEDPIYSPDGFNPLLATVVSRSAYGDLHRAGVPELTSWMSMSDAERARIRLHRRRAGNSVLRLVQGEGRVAAITSEGEEVA